MSVMASLFGHWNPPDDVFIDAVDQLLDGRDEFSTEFENEECGLHVLPGDIEVLLADRHVLVKGVHVGALVVVGPAEEVREEEHHS